MEIRFACPECERTAHLPVDIEITELACPHCNLRWPVSGRIVRDNLVHRCLVCPSTELYLRKDFPQRLGLAIVMMGFAISCVTWYFRMVMATFSILFATALLDVLLYFVKQNVLTCYRCHAEYRGACEGDHEAFRLEVHERFRQQKVRLKDQQDESNTGKGGGRPAGLARG